MSGSSKKPSGPPVTYEVGDIVLAKIKGYPPWPARIVDPDVTPPTVQRERPKGAKNTFYCVRFYPAGDHAWQVAKDMSKLLKHEIEAYIREPSKKSGELMDAYKTALDPTEWEARLEQLQQELEEEKRNASIDELEEGEDEDEEDAKPSSRKRKRLDDSGKRSKPKTTKAKKEPKAKSEETAPRSKKGRAKKNGALSAAEVVESEDDAAGEAKGDATRPMKRPKKEEEEAGDEGAKVKQWRYELQRSLLLKSANPKAEDMKQSSEVMTTLEEYTPQLTLELMSKSKIGRVVRKISELLDGVIPNNDEYNLRERAHKLVIEWSKIAADGANAASAAPATTTNGDVTMADASADADAHAEPDPTNGEVPEDENKTTPAVDVSEVPEQDPATQPEVTAADSSQQAPTNTETEMAVSPTNA